MLSPIRAAPALQQWQQLTFQHMKGHRPIDLLGMLLIRALLLQSRLGWLCEHALQVAQQQLRVRILPRRFGSLTVEIPQIQPALHHSIEGSRDSTAIDSLTPEIDKISARYDS